MLGFTGTITHDRYANNHYPCSQDIKHMGRVLHYEWPLTIFNTNDLLFTKNVIVPKKDEQKAKSENEPLSTKKKADRQ